MILELSLVFPLALNYCDKRLGHMTNLRSHDRHVTRQSRVVGPARAEEEGEERESSIPYSKDVQSLVTMFQDNGHSQLAISLNIQVLMLTSF